jgi:hypothetical protein
MKSIRRIHGWLGVLFAPSIILFALSGMFQLGGCHESEDGTPPSSTVVRLAMIHMHQTAELPKPRKRRPPPPQATEAGSAATAPAQPPRPPEGEHEEPFNPLKWFFVAMCLALITSSALGVWIAFTSKRDQKLHIGLLVAGIALPIVMLVV